MHLRQGLILFLDIVVPVNKFAEALLGDIDDCTGNGELRREIWLRPRMDYGAMLQ